MIVYSMVENCGISSAGWCCSEMEAYWGGNGLRWKQKLHAQSLARDCGARYNILRVEHGSSEIHQFREMDVTTLSTQKPGPESSLYGHCTPWKNEACCTENTTRDVHHTAMYGFSLDFCEEQTGQKMRDVCKKHFHRDLCFYECEPNIGPWVVKVFRR
ncbi:folate-binding protein, putative [Ixodes scapularis]|uniref:Folate-binding protein, putative n=1 Tax=Ixodes scapularis TaxID=6945 RepID=B7PZS9_IXOSC|nr:folate-binding protein, putative [Ixodes scapularis]|eukprot:XP_002405955.1 folate-binding protein, putative [Ixodes scapularis]